LKPRLRRTINTSKFSKSRRSEFLEWIKVCPDHLEVKVFGSPAFHVLLSEVGLKVPENVGVGGPTQQLCNLALASEANRR
jgi:hypothetical protein